MHDGSNAPSGEATHRLTRTDAELLNAAERDKRIHDIHEKRLNDMRKAFEQAMPLSKGKKAKKPKKR